MKDFVEMKRKEQEAFLMPPILNELKKLGGQATTKELRKAVVMNTEEIPENILFETKMSSKGNSYNPFNYSFNFSLANLEMADFVKAAGDTPFIVKGVLSTKDAEKCLKAGCRGIQLSHHHGIMSYAVPPLMMLKELLEVVRGEIPVFIDCGIESGMDVYKCLALGATAVSVGRHLMPLLKEGADKTAGRIKEMTGELAATMARTGVKDLKSFDPTVIHQRTF